jgi:hypothetical protein
MNGGVPLAATTGRRLVIPSRIQSRQLNEPSGSPCFSKPARHFIKTALILRRKSAAIAPLDLKQGGSYERQYTQQQGYSRRRHGWSRNFRRNGKKLYDVKGINIYQLSGELIGHLNNASGSDKRLDRATDRLFT